MRHYLNWRKTFTKGLGILVKIIKVLAKTLWYLIIVLVSFIVIVSMLPGGLFGADFDPDELPPYNATPKP